MYSKTFLFWVVNDPFVPKRRDIYLQSNSYLAYIWQALLIHWSTHLASVIQNEILCPLADLRAAFGEHTLFASRGGGKQRCREGPFAPSRQRSPSPHFFIHVQGVSKYSPLFTICVKDEVSSVKAYAMHYSVQKWMEKLMIPYIYLR